MLNCVCVCMHVYYVCTCATYTTPMSNVFVCLPCPHTVDPVSCESIFIQSSYLLMPGKQDPLRPYYIARCVLHKGVSEHCVSETLYDSYIASMCVHTCLLLAIHFFCRDGNIICDNESNLATHYTLKCIYSVNHTIFPSSITTNLIKC